jgi:DNA-binding IclR family transcriptional regulator
VVRPAHCTALGNVFLAALRPDQLDRLSNLPWKKELDYQEWFLKRVDEGFADLKQGRRLSWEEFEELRHRHRASRAKKRAKGA